MRVPFLLLTPCCVALGLAAAAWSGHMVDAPLAAVVLAGALAAHVAVNMLNEWSDFRTGVDARTVRTPFSGGSGSLLADPQAAPWVLAGGLLALALTMATGLWLLARSGPALLPLGLLGLALAAGYTPWITRQPLACLLAPGVGIGGLMVAGTAMAVAGRNVPSAWMAALAPVAQVSGLLLLNQFPDVDADRAAGRRHIPLLWGRPVAARLFAALTGLAYVAIAAGAASGATPPGTLLGLATLPLAALTARDALRHADDVPHLLPAMGRNVAVVLATPLLMAGGGLWLGR